MRAGLLIATALALPAAATPAFAQDPGAAANDEGVREIVVTAQRKSESVLSVPLSISTQTGEQLANRGIKDVTSLQFTEPGFLPSDTVGFTQLFVRGVGNSVYGYADPTVPIYVDDVPRLYPTMNATFFDVERIELLKGAQGGLYGRNATGGVLNIITRQPDPDTATGSARISYGTKQTFDAAGYVSVPLIQDKVAISIAGQRNSHDFYVKNIKNPNRYTAAMFPSGAFGVFTPQQTADLLNSGIDTPKGSNDKDLWSVAGKLLVQPTDNFKITFAADYSKKDDAGGDGLYNTTPVFQQGVLSSFLNFVFGIPAVLPAGFLQAKDGKFTNSLGVAAFNTLEDWGVSGKAIWSLPSFDITSITAYRKQKQVNLIDINDVNVPIILTDSTFRKHFFYQELRAVSSGTGPLHWLGGATYLKNHIDSEVRNPILPPLVDPPFNFSVDKVTNWSVYAQLGYDITEALNLTVSGRYIHEKHRTDFFPANEQVNLLEKKFLPSATLSYALDQGGTVYARWARGFKAGGVNAALPPTVFPTDLGVIFKPEQVDTFEAGYRASLFDRKVQLTTAVFYNKYKNLQVTAHSTPAYPAIIFAIVNAPKARTWGAEASLTWRAAKPLTLGATVGYLNAKYVRYTIVSDILQTDDLNGTRMINSPKLQLSFFGDLDQPVNGDFRLVGNVMVSHVSQVLFQPTGLRGVLPDAIGPAYWLANARLGVRTTDDRYGIAAYINNIFNQAYFVGGSSSSATGTTRAWGNPRIIGVEATAKF